VVQEVQRQQAAKKKAEEARQAALVKVRADNAAKQAEQDTRDQIRQALDVVRMGGGASFDCRKARTVVEMVICTDSRLAAQDKLLGQLYEHLFQETDEQGKQTLVESQKQWIASRNAQCSYTGPFKLDSNETQIAGRCLMSSINSRVAEFRKSDNDATDKLTARALGPGSVNESAADASPGLRTIPESDEAPGNHNPPALLPSINFRLNLPIIRFPN
jgi:uncharacterized protein